MFENRNMFVRQVIRLFLIY